MREIPIDKTLQILRKEPNSQDAFRKIISLGKDTLPSSIWDEFNNMDIARDVNDAKNWLLNQLVIFPNYNGIYLGLDTLNMEEGEGTNLELGLSNSCNPKIFDAEWSYECQFYGDSHLIKSLSDVSDSFANDSKWTSEEQSFTEYLIFLGYSGVILKEALLSLNLPNDYLSIWGFHDGDMFFLIQRYESQNHIVTEIDL